MPVRRILHISDIHCAVDKLKKVLQTVSSIDMVAVTGDLQCDSEMINVLKEAGVRVAAVTGNMDDTYIGRLLEAEGLSIESEVLFIDGLYFAGVSGREPVTSLNRVRQLVEELRVPGNKLILLSHHPPKGVVDKAFLGIHAGLYELREFDEEVQPRIHLCGHIHEARGVGWVGETLVVNPGPLEKGFYAVVDVEEKKAELERL